MDKKQNSLILFNENSVRRHWDKKTEQWFFSIIDIIPILAETSTPKRYWSDLKRTLKSEGSEVYDNIVRFKMKAPDGKYRQTDCFSTEDLFRVIQSIPSKKAEPFKKWLAKVGYERTKEIEDPELAIKRTRETYRLKGYSEEWIERRIQGIKIREELTDEWYKRGVRENQEFAILTT